MDVEDGQEVRPHHYIRSILPEGPVGQNARLKSGDELLEVSFVIYNDCINFYTSRIFLKFERNTLIKDIRL